MFPRHRLVPLARARKRGALLINSSPLLRVAFSHSRAKPPAVHLRVPRRVSRSLKLWYRLSIHCRQILAGPFQLRWVSLLPRPLLHSVTMRKGSTAFMPTAFSHISQKN